MKSTTLSVFLLAAILSTTLAQQQRPNSTSRATAATNDAKVTAKSARSEFHHQHHGGGNFEHHFPHHFGGGHHLGGHHKEFDHYLMPLLVILGLGVLVMPLLSVLMTTMVGNVPVTTLVSGRKKREIFGEAAEDKVADLFKRFGKAYEAFNERNK
ncbi:hypothetical protein JTE90_017466 [Oedothorax gibbosus]|uniref:Uncharacterized protein n=1 Tax=Oedothorax gibbosus TaxID=931172 RepID=A0AAV6U3F5_9ARAC|nr:hypothetical protein JTE90_017466 [Oedothorax gibbosus]